MHDDTRLNHNAIFQKLVYGPINEVLTLLFDIQRRKIYLKILNLAVGLK